MSQNQIIAIVAAVVILIAIISWVAIRQRRSGSDFTAATAGTFAATDASAAAAALTVLEAHSKATPGASKSRGISILYSASRKVSGGSCPRQG